MHNTIGASAACVFRTMGDNDTKLRRDHIQSLRNIFANAMQTTTAGTDQAFWFNYFIDTRQMLWQRTAIDGTWL